VPRTHRRPAARVFRSALILALASATAAVGAPSVALAKSTKGKKADLAIQKQGVLTAADFPPGWTSQPAVPSTEPPASNACADLRAVDEALKSSATKSLTFLSPGGEQAGNLVAVVKSATKASSYLEPYGEPSAIDCVQAQLQATFKQPQILATRISVSQTTGAPPPGADEGVAFHAQVNATLVTQQTGVVFVDLLSARVGRSVVQFVFLSPTAASHDQQINAVISRLKAAGA